MRRSILFFGGAAVLLLLHIQFVHSQTTEFTYQGSLNTAGTPASGNHDFEFLLFDALSGGNQVGTTIALNNVAVANGVFSVKLNFGNQFISGASRFLEIRVRPSGQAGMTILSPRQLIGSSPYAIKSLGALNAESATTASNALSANNALLLGGVAAGQYVLTNDPRMSDARPPIPGSPSYIQNGTSPQASSNFNISSTGTANVFDALSQYNLGSFRILSNGGASNLFVGVGAGNANPTGNSNAFVGNNAGFRNTTGSSNAFFGASAGESNTVGSFNSFFGKNAGLANTLGSGNTFFGESAGRFNADGQKNAFFGRNSGLFNVGSQNSFFGEDAGRANSSGEYNAFFGHRAGALNTTAGGNSYFGAFAGEASTGGGNAFFGLNAGRMNTTGYGNSFFGSTSGLANTIGYSNSFFGGDAGTANTLGRENAFFGADAGQANTIGIKNVFVGANSGTTNTVGSANTLLGSDTAVSSNDLIYATAIGASAVAPVSNSITLGRAGGEDTVRIPGALSLPNLGGGGSVSICRFFSVIVNCSSSARYKSNIAPFVSGLGLIKKLRPVSFNWKEGGMLDIGLVAEDVAAIEPLLTTRNDKGEVEGVKYNRVAVVLINAVKEQQEQIEAQNRTINRQQSEINQLKQIVCALKPSAKICSPK